MKDVKLGGGLILTDTTVKVRFKKLSEEAVAPKIMKIGDAGADLTTTGLLNDTGLYVEYGTGLAVEIPAGYVGYIFPRSSISNYHLSLTNAVGVIDSNYRGEIKFRFRRTWDSDFAKKYQTGDRIGQLVVMPIPTVEFEEVEELSESNRGENGYGSSGA
jgi:dUTP pyrophosphatase